MKRIKSLGLGVCAIFLAVAIFIGGSFSTFAYASEDQPVPNTPAFNGEVVREVDLGKQFSVPSTLGNDYYIDVTAPNGRTVTPESDKVIANQLGNYNVEVKDTATDRILYSYNVFCSMSEDYSVYVAYDGATIPTIMQKDNSFIVPDVFLGYTDDDGELQSFIPEGIQGDINGFDVTLSGVAHDRALNDDGNIKITATESGTLILRYSISIHEGKFYSKEYSITVQNTVNTSDPKLNVVNVPLTANVNTKVTLPIATATSTTDARVFVDVNVYHSAFKDVTPDGRVVSIGKDEIDEDTGYAIPGDDYKNNPVATFDNVRDMSFYATELGEYRVTYQAIDTHGNKSTLHDYYIQCTDGLAPVFVDFDHHDIPTKWGLNVKNGNPVDNSVRDYILLPIPTVKDNADEEKDLSVSLDITDPRGNRVLRFTNILDAKEGRTGNGHIAAVNNKYYSGTAGHRTFEEDGFKFYFGEYKLDDISDVLGAYTFVYRVTDSSNKGRTYSPTITLTLSNSFEDTKAPQIDPLDAVKYILLGDGGNDTLDIPAANVSDDNDANPNIVYTITYTDLSTPAVSVSEILNKPETLDIVKNELEGGAVEYLLTNGDDFELPIGNGKIEISVVATDDVGNTSDPQTKDVFVYTIADNAQNDLEFYANFNTTLSRIKTDPSTQEQTYLPKLDIGSFRIEGAVDAKFAGFEVSLRAPSGAIVPVTLDRMVIGNDIFVNNLNFVAKEVTADNGDKHVLSIRVFDVVGNSDIYIFEIDVTGTLSYENPYAKGTSTVVPSTGASQNTVYSLKGNPTNTADRFAVVRVSGNSFSLMGNDFIANRAGSYLIEEYWIHNDNLNVDKSYDEEKLVHFQTYSTQVNASSAPVIEILGTMPAYSAKFVIDTGNRFNQEAKNAEDFVREGWVLLPSVAAFNSDSNAEVTIEVTDRSSTKVDAYKVYQAVVNNETVYKFFRDGEEEPGYDFANVWAFAPADDGAYTVTFTATLNNSNKATSSHTILVGKITGPSFTLSEVSRKALAIDSTFTFSAIENVIDEKMTANQIKAYTYVKKLIDPSGNVVVEIKGNDQDKFAPMKDNNGTTIKLEKSGTYTEVYEVTDTFGNTTTITNEFQVTAKSRGATTSMKMLSTILIIVAVLLLAGAIFYVVRFRKVKRLER